MAYTKISITDCINLVTAVLNASPGVYGTSTDPLFTTGEIADAVEAADLGVWGVILDTPGHWALRTFLKKITVTDGQVMDFIFAGGVEIDGKPGRAASAHRVNRLQDNLNSLTTTGGYYCIQGNMIHFTGTTCSVDGIELDSETVASPISPAGYTPAVVAGALMILFPKEGSNVAAASHFAGIYQAHLQLIRSGARALPAVAPFMPGGAG